MGQREQKKSVRTVAQATALKLFRTSVRAQLQLMAVQRKMFIRSMMRKSTARAMATHSSHDGRIPFSSQIADTTGGGEREEC